MEDAELRNILFSIQGSIAGFQNDMSDVKNDIADMKTDITNMKKFYNIKKYMKFLPAKFV